MVVKKFIIVIAVRSRIRPGGVSTLPDYGLGNTGVRFWILSKSPTPQNYLGQASDSGPSEPGGLDQGGLG